MENNCGACASPIIDDYMECTNEKCMKRYDIACLEISKVAFTAYTQNYIKKWLCPECICAKPKRCNSETPIRINIAHSNHNIATPENNVCSQRGTRSQYSPMIDSDTLLLEELRQFKADMIARMDSQANAISLLLNQFAQTKTELGNIVKMMEVLEEKVEAKFTKLTQYNQPHEIAADIPRNSPSPSSFAEVVRQQNNSTDSKNTLHTNNKSQKVHKCGATKSIEQAVCTTSAPTTCEQPADEAKGNDSGWTTVRNKKNYRQPKEVRVGTNTELKAIQVSDRKKYLHVWRLHPDTTVEAIQDHVKNVCGPDVQIKVDKIKHKIKRDYSSFVVGVPEKCFEMLNHVEIWPMNAEFSEWTWFRNFNRPKPNIP